MARDQQLGVDLTASPPPPRPAQSHGSGGGDQRNNPAKEHEMGTNHDTAIVLILWAVCFGAWFLWAALSAFSITARRARRAVHRYDANAAAREAKWAAHIEAALQDRTYR